METTPLNVAGACQLECWKDGPNLRFHPVSEPIELHGGKIEDLSPELQGILQRRDS